MTKRRATREERLKRISKSSTRRHELLNMRNRQLFSFDIKEVLKATTIDPNTGAQFVAQVMARASRQGIDEAKDYVVEKQNEGIVDEALADQVLSLLDRYSRYR